ncbi:7_t:CDS:1, partial [Racocetra persica]
LLTENDASTKYNAINPVNPNLYICNIHSRHDTNITAQLLQPILSNNYNKNHNEENMESTIKQKYVCKLCKNPGHNSQRCNGNGNK